LSFKLINGKVFAIDDKELSQIDYKEMYINDSVANADIVNFDTSYKFWKDNLKNR
jgi:lipopolysaccharide export system permease protein